MTEAELLALASSDPEAFKREFEKRREEANRRRRANYKKNPWPIRAQNQAWRDNHQEQERQRHKRYVEVRKAVREKYKQLMEQSAPVKEEAA